QKIDLGFKTEPRTQFRQCQINMIFMSRPLDTSVWYLFMEQTALTGGHGESWLPKYLQLHSHTARGLMYITSKYKSVNRSLHPLQDHRKLHQYSFRCKHLHNNAF